MKTKMNERFGGRRIGGNDEFDELRNKEIVEQINSCYPNIVGVMPWLDKNGTHAISGAPSNTRVVIAAQMRYGETYLVMDSGWKTAARLRVSRVRILITPS